MHHIPRGIALGTCILAALAGIAGCSGGRQSGTLVTFAFPTGKHLSRPTVAKLSRYLVMRSGGVLGVENARVESVTESTLTLLLPDKRLVQEDIGRLLVGTGLEFYHLRGVATKQHPDRPWHIEVPARALQPYVFTGPDDRRLDSHVDVDAILEDVVGTDRPILTGRDIQPTANSVNMGSGYAISVRFTDEGSRIFHNFTLHNRGEYLAVFYNGALVSAPVIGEPIKGGEAYITGFRTGAAAQMAVNQINAGMLPVPLKIISVKHLGGSDD